MSSSKNSTKKPFYKKAWFWGIIIIFGIIGAIQDKDTTVTDQNESTLTESNQKSDKAIETTEPIIPEPKTENTETESNTVKSKVEPDKDLMVISDLFEVIRKDEKTVDEWKGSPSSRKEGKFRLSGTETKVPSITSLYEEDDLEVVFIDGKAQRITYTINPIIGWKYDEKSIHDFMYSMGLGDAEVVESTDKVTIYKHKDLYSVQVFNDNGNLGYLYIIADEQYK